MVKALNLVLILILLAGLGIVMVFPFAWMVLGSFKAESEMFAEGAITWLPQQWILDNYRHAFKELDFPIYFRNTIIYAGVVAFLQIVLSSLGGYAYARLRFPGRDFLFMFLLATMMIPYHCRIIPVFIMLRNWPLAGGNNIWGAGGTGFLDSFPGLILPGLTTAFGTFLLRQFFLVIPRGLEDAARIDGCSEFRIFWNIMLPLAKPALAVLTLFSIQYNWNEFLWPLIVTASKRTTVLQVAITFLRDVYTVEWGMIMASVTITVFPLIIVFFFTQRYFVRGIILTGMKG
jgi:multiple sugar transport system permease protein